MECVNSYSNTGELRMFVNSAPIIKQPVSKIAEDAAAQAAIRDMNLLPATRIGWERKQQYTDRLAQLSAEGYLDPGEYEARMGWLQNAKTEEEARLVFRDLPSLRVAKVELAPHLRRTHPRQWERRNTGQAAFWFAVNLGLLITSLAAGGLVAALVIFLPLTILWGWALITRAT